MDRLKRGHSTQIGDLNGDGQPYVGLSKSQLNEIDADIGDPAIVEVDDEGNIRVLLNDP